MKQVFEGYLCHTESKFESWGYDDMLCKSEPVTKEIDHHTGEWTEEVTIRQPDDDIVVLTDAIFDDCEYGKKYRVTVEEICPESLSVRSAPVAYS